MFKESVSAIAAVAAVGVMTSAASGQVISDWVLFQEPGDQAFTAASSSALNVSGLDLTRGPGLNPSPGNNSISSNGWDGLDPGDYFTFGFEVDAGWSVDLDELWIGTRSSNTGPGELGLFYSGDNFSTNLFTFNQSGTDFNNSIIDLSSLTGLTGEVEFRILATSDIRANGDPGISPSGTFRITEHFDDGNFTNVQFTGTVVPTPGAIALLGVAGLAGIRRRR